MKRRITVLTKETYERVTLAGLQARPARVWCEGCGAEAEMITLEEAARLSSVSVRDVYRAVLAGLVHFAEPPDGMLLVCAASLPARPTAPSPRRLTTGEP